MVTTCHPTLIAFRAMTCLALFTQQCRESPAADAPGVPETAPAATSESPEAPTIQGPGRPPGLDGAFDFSPDLGGTREFLMNQPEKPDGDASEWWLRINLARQQREAGDFNVAFANLQAVLDGKTAEALKKTALLELATTQLAAKKYTEALKTYGVFAKRYPQDLGLPEVLFRQGQLLRELGAPQAALTKFHAVMATALNLNLDEFKYYRRLVLLAQGQIADTLYVLGNLEEAADKYRVLMRDESSELNQAMIQYRLILCLESLNRPADLIAQAGDYLARHAETAQGPHVRYLLAGALKTMGRNGEALRQVKALLESPAARNSPDWKVWQQKTGNDIANRLYQDGDYHGALDLYLNLVKLDPGVSWQLPVWYQVGLIHERLEAPAEAINAYQRILDREPELAAGAPPGLTTLVSMARWRRDFIHWKFEAEKSRIQLQQSAAAPAAAVKN